MHLRAEVLLDGEGVVGAALHGRIVRDDDALAPLHEADPGHHAGRGRVAVVEVPGRERGELEEGRALVEQPLHAFPDEELAARLVLLAGVGTPALGDLRQASPELAHETAEVLFVLPEVARSGVDPGRYRLQDSLGAAILRADTARDNRKGHKGFRL
jgi:hypothetical protein